MEPHGVPEPILAECEVEFGLFAVLFLSMFCIYYVFLYVCFVNLVGDGVWD